MKVAIASPPVRDMYFTPGRSSALGMNTVAYLLRKTGYHVYTLNCPLENPKGRSIPPLEETDHLKPFILRGERGPVSFFTGYRRFGPDFKTCAERLLSQSRKLILISCFAWAYAEDTLELAAEIRKINSDVYIGIGGSGASSYPEYFLQKGDADFVIAGESEPAIQDLMNQLNRKKPDFTKITNCFTNTGSTVVPPEKTESAGEKDMEFVWSITGESRNRIFISTSLSRGCPKRCRFCSNFITHGRVFRKVSPDKIRDGIKRIPRRKPVVLNFEDDNLTADPEYFFSILRMFTSAIPEISFMAENGIDYTFLDASKVKKLAEFGLRQFNLSLGTIGRNTAVMEKRPLSLRKYESVIEEIDRHNLPVITYFICGLDGDTPESTAETLKYLSGINTAAGISPFYPVPGLPGFTDRRLFNRHTPSLCRGSSFYPWNGTLTTGQMVTAFRISRYINLSKRKNITAQEQSLLDKIRETGKLHTFIRDRKENIISPVPHTDNTITELFFGR